LVFTPRVRLSLIAPNHCPTFWQQRTQPNTACAHTHFHTSSLFAHRVFLSVTLLSLDANKVIPSFSVTLCKSSGCEKSRRSEGGQCKHSFASFSYPSIHPSTHQPILLLRSALLLKDAAGNSGLPDVLLNLFFLTTISASNARTISHQSVSQVNEKVRPLNSDLHHVYEAGSERAAIPTSSSLRNIGLFFPPVYPIMV
jgi:hypothetical protein